MRTVPTTLLLAFLLISTTAAQPGPPDPAQPVEGVVHVKFAPEGLPALKQRIRPDDLPEAASRAKRNRSPLRRMLHFNEGRKVFSNFTPADTVARHRDTGKQVQLLDLSRWYTLTVPDTTAIGALVERLEKHPLVEAAARQVPYQPSVAVPSDDEFQNGDQWNVDNPLNDADILTSTRRKPGN